MAEKKMKSRARYGHRVLAKGVNVTNNTRETGLNNNDIVIGSSGSGKTGGYVIPNIQKADGSIVVSDTKGRLHRMFKDSLIKRGYEVYKIDFVNPEDSCPYNPLSQIGRNKDGSLREKDIMTVANSLMPALDESEPIWEQSAKLYLAFLIGYLLEAVTDKNEQTLVTLCELHRAFNSGEDGEGMKQFLPWIESHEDSFAARKYGMLMANRKADKMFASIMGFVNIALEPFDYKEAHIIFGKYDGFDISSLGNKKTALFLNVSDVDSTFDKTVNLFYAQTLQTLCREADANEDGMLKVPVRIIMDDFAASARIEDFNKIISVIRSRDISVSLILQSLPQITGMYGEADATVIMDNCDHMLYLGTQNQETANIIANRAMKTPEDILYMPVDKAYILTRGQRAEFVDKVMPYSTLDFESSEDGADGKEELEGNNSIER